MKSLTEKQKNVLRLIAQKVNEAGFPPTLQELADELGVASKNAVLKHLNALEKKGYIGKREGGAARGIRILDSMGFLDARNVNNVPLVGAVPAGCVYGEYTPFRAGRFSRIMAAVRHLRDTVLQLQGVCGFSDSTSLYR